MDVEVGRAVLVHQALLFVLGPILTFVRNGAAALS